MNEESGLTKRQLRKNFYNLVCQNPNWTQKQWVTDDGGYCSIGYVLHTIGVSDENIKKYPMPYTYDYIHTVFELNGRLITLLMALNDKARDFEELKEFYKVALFGSIRKGWRIIDGYDND